MRTPLAVRLCALACHVEGLTWRELDRLAGLGEGHAAQIANGTKRNPWLSTVRKIAEVFGVPTAYLYEGQGEPPSPEELRATLKRARALDKARRAA